MAKQDADREASLVAIKARHANEMVKNYRHLWPSAFDIETIG